jgi:hypothetical protein
MTEYIDKEKFRSNLEVDCYGRTDIVKIARAMEKAKVDMPKAVPVTYCKDCQSYNTKGCAPGFGWCTAWDNGRMDNHYCNFGERKNDD